MQANPHEGEVGTSVESTADREIVITRTLDAPRELVFKAWTDPSHISNWWGPNGFTTTTHSMDVRPGGAWIYIMHGPDGVDYKNKIVYREVVAPERLEYLHGTEGDIENDPARFEVTVTFKDLGGRTELTMRSIFVTAEYRQMVVEKFGAIEGGKQTLGRLAEYLPTME